MQSVPESKIIWIAKCSSAVFMHDDISCYGATSNKLQIFVEEAFHNLLSLLGKWTTILAEIDSKPGAIKDKALRIFQESKTITQI